jgi:A118 family predicted phage portal protein
MDYMQENSLSTCLTAKQAWDELQNYKANYYRKYAAAYSGERFELIATAESGSFWKRNGKCRVHVPIAADIAATSSDLLFSEEPRFTCYDEATEDSEAANQRRLDDLIAANNVHGLLNEAAEANAALGDVYLKLNSRSEEVQHPILTVTQGDCAWPEYVLGVLKCVHFFDELKRDFQKGIVWRIYERYERGKITMSVFQGSSSDLGTDAGSDMLEQLGYQHEMQMPIDDMLAVHIPNIKPNRIYRSSVHGRSDYDGLRDLMDSLDEAYSSWMRDIRLAKARLIVPAEYLRRKASDMFRENEYTYEFDEDVETLVALDIDPQYAGGNPITPSQFAIRSAEHAATCADLIRSIVTNAGYAPQSFGIGIEGNAQSGTALHIREKKSFNTQGKKQTYWKTPLENIMTAMIHLDAALFPGMGSERDDAVKVHFADNMANDIATTANAIEMLHRAAAISTEIKVQMLHPDWTKKQIAEEVDRIKAENGLEMQEPDMFMGDLDNPNAGNNGGEDGDE